MARALLWMGTFVALSFVGSGALSQLLTGSVGASAEAQASGLAPDVGGRSLSGIAGGAPAEACGPSPPSRCRPRDGGAERSDGGASPPPRAITDDGRVVLNVATEHDLTRLPGIGAKRAQAIVALRTRLGRFRRVEELLRVRGIGPRSLRRLRPLVVLDPPPAPGRDRSR